VDRSRLPRQHKHNSLYELPGNERLRITGQRVAARATDVEDVVDHAQYALARFVALLHGICLLLCKLAQHAIHEHLGVTEHHIKRRAQFMADIRHETLLNAGKPHLILAELITGRPVSAPMDSRQHQDQRRRREKDDREANKRHRGDVERPSSHHKQQYEKEQDGGAMQCSGSGRRAAAALLTRYRS